MEAVEQYSACVGERESEPEPKNAAEQENGRPGKTIPAENANGRIWEPRDGQRETVRNGTGIRSTERSIHAVPERKTAGQIEKRKIGASKDCNCAEQQQAVPHKKVD